MYRRRYEKAVARQSPNCIRKTKKIKYGEKRFPLWRMEFFHLLGWQAIEFAQMSAILKFYFRFWFRPYHRSRHVILHQSASAKFYPRQKTDVMSILKMADLRHFGFSGSNNGLFEKPMYDFLCIAVLICYIYTVSRKKGATDFFAVTFTNIDGFS